MANPIPPPPIPNHPKTKLSEIAKEQARGKHYSGRDLAAMISAGQIEIDISENKLLDWLLLGFHPYISNPFGFYYSGISNKTPGE